MKGAVNAGQGYDDGGYCGLEKISQQAVVINTCQIV